MDCTKAAKGVGAWGSSSRLPSCWPACREPRCAFRNREEPTPRAHRGRYRVRTHTYGGEQCTHTGTHTCRYTPEREEKRQRQTQQGPSKKEGGAKRQSNTETVRKRPTDREHVEGCPLELCGPTALGRTHPREPRKETDRNGCLKEPQRVEGEVCQGGPHGEDREPGPARGMEVGAGHTHRACCRCMSSKPQQTLLGRPLSLVPSFPGQVLQGWVSRNRERQATEPRVTLLCPVRNPLALCL